MTGKIVPPKIKPDSDNGYFEILTKAVFQAGFSHEVIHNKWKGFKEIFENFEVNKISNWTKEEILNAVESPKIVRNMKKIQATVDNAKSFQEIVNSFGSFDGYLGTIRDKGYQELSKHLIKQFKWLGQTGAYYFLYCVDEEVPNWHDRKY
ncbi:MAG: DNA-3-methyladenine glycosylase I [Candidatus Heimdallarchaeota archaeon]|nr:DNA-3-methyladenine glycosylase I [Candidatus Heimdallarchaeota archaeon]